MTHLSEMTFGGDVTEPSLSLFKDLASSARVRISSTKDQGTTASGDRRYDLSFRSPDDAALFVRACVDLWGYGSVDVRQGKIKGSERNVSVVWAPEFFVESVHETSRVSITAGMARAMIHGAARQCPGCKFGFPKYPGRYPKTCPRCQGDVPGPDVSESTDEALPVVCVSQTHRIQQLIEAGRQSFGPYLRDDSCSRVVSVTYDTIDEVVGGVAKLKQFLEGPIEHDFYYRVESVQDPVLIVEFDDRNKRARVFATTNPSRYLLLDPLAECVVEDHESTFEATASVDEGILSSAAEKVIGALRRRVDKLVRFRDQLEIVRSIWEDAAKDSSTPIPMTSDMRMAKGLSSELPRAFIDIRESVDEAQLVQGEFALKPKQGNAAFKAKGFVSHDGVWGVEKTKGGFFLNHVPSGAAIAGFAKRDTVETVIDQLDAIDGADWRSYSDPKRIPKSVMAAAGKIVTPSMSRSVRAPARETVAGDKDIKGYVAASIKELKASVKFGLTEHYKGANNLYTGGRNPPVSGQEVAWAGNPSAFNVQAGDNEVLVALSKELRKPIKMKLKGKFSGAKTYDITITWGAPRWDTRYQGSGLLPAVSFTWTRSTGESTVPADDVISESLTASATIGLFLAVVGGVPMLLSGLSKAAKWMGFDKVHEVLARAHHVMHTVESHVVDYTIPDRLSYAAYVAAWRRGWRLADYVSRRKGVDAASPVSFDYFKGNDELRGIVDGTLFKMLLCYFAIGGIAHLLTAPLSALFAVEAVATGVKGAEISAGISKMAKVVAALESVQPNVRMVALDAHGLYEAIPVSMASSVELFYDEQTATDEAAELGLELSPSRRLIGEEQLWALVHTQSGFALGRGEVTRLREVAEREQTLEEAYGSSTGPAGRALARSRAVDRSHQRVTGEFCTEEETRRSSRRPRKPGENLSHPIQGFRFSKSAQERKPRKDVQKSLQNKRNASRPGASPRKIAGLKKWHASHDGKQYHHAQAEFNRQRRSERVDDVRDKVMDVKDRILRYSAGQQRSIMRESENNSYTDSTPTVEDDFEALLRRLIVTQDMDVLSDVEFDDNTGAIYMFFDPILRPDEAEEILASLKQAKGGIQLIASPDMSLPNEMVESDWWVFFLPGIGEDVASPDPTFYARSPEDHGTKVQMVVMAQSPDVEAIAQDVDVSKMLDAAGK